MLILAIDPGESSGWVMYNLNTGELTGSTIKLDRLRIWELLSNNFPDIIVFESFKLYATHARTLIGNKFYTCEIIGILKLWDAMYPDCKLVEQGADSKKYSGAKTSDASWNMLKTQYGVSEHTFDAYQHLMYPVLKLR